MKNGILYLIAAISIVVTVNTSNAAGWVPGHYHQNGHWENGYWDPDYTTPTSEIDPRMTQPTDHRVDHRTTELEPTDPRVDHGNTVDSRLRNRSRRTEEDFTIHFGDSFNIEGYVNRPRSIR